MANPGNGHIMRRYSQLKVELKVLTRKSAVCVRIESRIESVDKIRIRVDSQIESFQLQRNEC